MKRISLCFPSLPGRLFLIGLFLFFPLISAANSNVHVTRFWHNHQPIYWPDWEDGAGPYLRVQYAHDSIQRKPGQTYGGLTSYSGGHPDNDLVQIFSLDDRIAAYQGRPRDALQNIGEAGGFAMSYTGSLIDNIRNLAANGAWYSGDWNSGNTQARGWTTPSGSPRLDLVGFSYHHSLTPLLPRSVLRKEIQLFKQAWWKAWGGNMDLSDHSKGFFPTEMAFSSRIIDVLVEEGYEWVIVASHHLSRTSPSYNNFVNPDSFGIASSPPNRADQIGPEFNNADQWWYGEPNPGMGAWNVAPYAYQLHRVRHVNPETGQEYSIIAVPSDDVLSYEYGYANAGIGHIHSQISPHANDPGRPVIVMPSSDGDNAWGGGFDSWINATPQMFGDAENSGYQITAIQDFVNAHGGNAPLSHIEDGAWIFPEMCYGSPYFLKWIEPPVGEPGSPTMYPNTQVDIENGWALKFFAYAPKMAGANWVETAEQIWVDDGGVVRPWVIQDPNDWDGQGNWGDGAPNVAELGWHIYLTGLDSGFQYYGGLGNDDEVKPPLAAKRTVQTLEGYVIPRIEEDRTPPTVLVPQRFPYNPGGYTFGWFNPTPENGNYLKQMPSEFYIWTLAYDISGIESADLMIRRSKTGYRSLDNTDNETYAGGPTVEDWVRIPMTRRVLPSTRAELNARANNPQIDYWPMDPAFWSDPQIADQYYVRIDDSVLPNFRDNLFDYYVEAVDTRGNTNRTDIQHVYVEDDGEGVTVPTVNFSPDPNDCSPLTITYSATGGDLEGIDPAFMQISFDEDITWTRYEMTQTVANVWSYTVMPPEGAPSAIVWFENTDGSIVDSNNDNNWSTTLRDCSAPDGPVWTDPPAPDGCDPITIYYDPSGRPISGAAQVYIHVGRNDWQDVLSPDPAMTLDGGVWSYTYHPPPGTEEINFVFNDGAEGWDNNDGNNWNVTVTNCEDEPPPPSGLVITNPPSDIVVGHAVDNYTLQGIAEDVEGDLYWTNALTGASGSLPVATPWSIPEIALDVGQNVITVSGEIPGSGEEVVGEDRADNYDPPAWETDANQGSGFGAWNMWDDGADSGFFIGDSTADGHGDINSVGVAFGLFGHSGQWANAQRSITEWGDGHTFSISLAVQWREGARGVSLFDPDGFANENEIWNFDITGDGYGGSPFDYYSDMVLNFQITQDGGDLDILVSGSSAGEAWSDTWSTTVTGEELGGFRLYTGNAPGSDDERNLYFNNLSIVKPGTGEGVWTSVTVTITRETDDDPDSNDDGVPDSFYIGHGLDHTDPDVGQTMAPNGYTYRDSYFMNLDPDDDTIPPFRMLMNGDRKFTFEAPTGRVYEVQYKDDLMHPVWSNLHIISVGEDIMDNGDAPRRFYRVRFHDME